MSEKFIKDVCHDLGNLMMTPYYLRCERDNYDAEITEDDYKEMGRILFNFLPKYEKLMGERNQEVFENACN